MVNAPSTPRRDIVSHSTGYHPMTGRKVELAIDNGALTVRENGETVTLTRAEARPIVWVGQNRVKPLVPLPGLVLAAPGGEWVVATGEMTIDLDGPGEQASPHPHVWVNADDLARMAGACGIQSTRKAPPPDAAFNVGNPLKVVIILAVLGIIASVVMTFSMRERSDDHDCGRQRNPAKQLHPRLSCADARAELDRVARGEARPRNIVLRPIKLTIDAKSPSGPATISCDGIEFAVENAGQADPNAPIVFREGPHAVLAKELPDGRLSGLQTVVCGNIVAGERRHE